MNINLVLKLYTVFVVHSMKDYHIIIIHMSEIYVYIYDGACLNMKYC
jgi:hypothetical protein